MTSDLPCRLCRRDATCEQQLEDAGGKGDRLATGEKPPKLIVQLFGRGLAKHGHVKDMFDVESENGARTSRNGSPDRQQGYQPALLGLYPSLYRRTAFPATILYTWSAGTPSICSLIDSWDRGHELSLWG